MGIIRKTSLPIIDLLQKISIKDLNRDNILKYSSYTGTVNFFRNGVKTGSVNIRTDISDKDSFIRIFYSLNNKKYDYVIQLIKVPSNLKNECFYYYFKCPVTGNKSSKLYLVDGIFRARSSFKYIYDSQTESKLSRNFLLFYSSLDKINKIEKKLSRLSNSNIDRKDKFNGLIKKLAKLEKKQNSVLEFISVM